jgi:hypothetical protein
VHWITYTALQVEKAPVVIKTSVAKADADSLQKQLEAGEWHGWLAVEWGIAIQEQPYHHYPMKLACSMPSACHSPS